MVGSLMGSKGGTLTPLAAGGRTKDAVSMIGMARVGCGRTRTGGSEGETGNKG